MKTGIKMFFALAILHLSPIVQGQLKNLEIDGGMIIFEKKHSESLFNKQTFVSRLTLFLTGFRGQKSLWDYRFGDPCESGTGSGFFKGIEFYTPDGGGHLFAFMISSLEPLTVVRIDADGNGEFHTSESVFKIRPVKPNPDYELKVAPFGDDRLVISIEKLDVAAHEEPGSDWYVYNLRLNQLDELLAVEQLLYPNLPLELALFRAEPIEGKKPWSGRDTPRCKHIKIDGVIHENLVGDFPAMLPIDIQRITPELYLAIMAAAVRDRLHGKIAVSPAAEFADRKAFIADAIASLGERLGVDLSTPLSKLEYDDTNRWKLALDNYLKERVRPGEDIPVTEEGLGIYRDNFEWALEDFPKHYESQLANGKRPRLHRTRDEIRRLRRYGLDDLLDNPPKVEIRWKTWEEITGVSREEAEAIKRAAIERTEILKRLEEPLFSEGELAELWVEPDYGKMADPLGRARAYDFHGRYAEALKTLESAAESDARAKVELGLYLRAGRPGIPADEDGGVRLLRAALAELPREGGDDPESHLWRGRALLELSGLEPDVPRRRDMAERAASELAKAAAGGRAEAWYYRNHHYRTRPQELDAYQIARAAESGHPDAAAFMAWLALNRPKWFPGSVDGASHLAAIKESIRRGSLFGQYALGAIYLEPPTFGDYPPIAKNPARAVFWLRRAAERGDPDARNAIGQPLFKDAERAMKRAAANDGN